MKTALELVGFAQRKLGCAYLYGAIGETVSAGLIDRLAGQYPKMYTETYRRKAQALIGKQAFDCVGLIKACYWDGKYNADTDLSADGMYAAATQKGSLAALPEQPGLLVWRAGHIGVYIGGGEVVEARGIDYGVVRAKLAGRNFTHWCRCPFVQYDAAAHWAKAHLDSLRKKGIIQNPEAWNDFDASVSKGMALALVDKALGKY